MKKNTNKYKKKRDVTTSLIVSLTKLEKESNRPHGVVDKIAEKQAKLKQQSPPAEIHSSFILKRNCGRLINYLHQTMQHSVAIKVNEVSKQIADNMSQRAMKKIVDVLTDISQKHGFNFGK